MRKLALTICLIAVSMIGFAQRSNVSKADRLSDREKPDFKGAREAIKLAFEDESTKNDPKTYFVAGMIGHKENEKYVTDMMLQKDIDQAKKGAAIMESYAYFNKSYELGQIPNRRGKIKNKYAKKIKKRVKEYFVESYNLISYGAYFFDNGKNDEALKVFETYLEIPKQPYMNGEISMNDSTYKMIKYFAAIAATRAKKSDKAIELYTDLLDDEYETKNVYQLLSEEYASRKDTVNQVKVLEDGFAKYQNDPWFLQNIINIFIYSGQVEKASAYLDKAIEQSPDVAEYYYVKGNVDERLKNYDSARKAFDKALELDPNMAEAYSGIGRLIFNEGVEMLNAATDIKDNAAYNAEIEKANTIFKKAQPFMEKAVELNPEDLEFKKALRTLYYRLEDQEKYDAISKELGY